MASYLERYNSGEYKTVWKELIELKDGILDPDIYDDADEVARTTMKRVRYNVEMLYDKLIELKYDYPSFTRAVPSERMGDVAEAETFLHKIPLSVRAWYEEVGEVCFTGKHPYLSSGSTSASDIYSDPLCCEFFELFPGHIPPEDVESGYVDSDFISFAPDLVMKHGYSGGTYIMNIADNPMDAKVEIDFDTKHLADIPMEAKVTADKEIYFIDHLRDNFFWGGFPGFKYGSKIIQGVYPRIEYKQGKFPLIELSYLTEDLLEF